MKHFIVPIAGMHCRSCEILLEEHIGQVQGVRSVQVSYKNGQADVGFKTHCRPDDHAIENAVKTAGYSVGYAEKPRWLSRTVRDYWEVGIAALLLLALYFVARWTGLLGVSVQTENLSIPFAVVIGLVAGVSTCMAVVGGLVLGISARYGEQHPDATPWQKFRPHLLFNVGRIGGYAAFGGLLGALGSVLRLSNGVLALLTIGVGIVMMLLGLKLTGLSPRLKQTSITLPSWIGKRLGLSRAQQKTGVRSSLLTGALTFFLPCGFTQAMQLYAISSGSFGRGALVLALFALGTAPALLSIGGLTSVVKGVFARRFYTTVGLAVLVFGLVNVRNGVALTGFATGNSGSAKTAAITSELKGGYQIVRMNQLVDRYQPNKFTIAKGIPVKWIITSESSYSCAAFIVMPKYGISVSLKQGENTVEFTPTSTGTIPFSCSMGMYRGSFTVVEPDGSEGSQTSGSSVRDDGRISFTPTAPNESAPPPSAGAGCGSGGGAGCGGCGGGGSAKPKTIPSDAPIAKLNGKVQTITTRDNSGKLEPSFFKVKAGVPVEWTVTSDGPPVGCMNAFLNRDLGIQERQSQRAGSTVIRFTPDSSGDYDVTCGMGMWRGTVSVIN
ncbi:MAG: sulfite exporter TauE/SafE family protein [Candidatus Kerfeldbacteria bacterium]|nr:sulfite exporter TauE/SafE family protein [Candidatus Kerfeldbacteria bacterium]